MDEPTVKTLLNTLANWQAQKDLLNMDKRKLLEEVKVPDEVQAVISTGKQEIEEVENQLSSALKVISDQYDERMADIVIPDEIKEVLAKIDLERGMLSAYRQKQEEEVHGRARTLRIEIQEKIEFATADVFKSNDQRKADIEAEFSGKSGALDENIAKLTEQIKNAVKEIGYTVDSEFYQARYTKPKKSWIPQRLEKYTEDHPEIQSCYTLGDPSVAIVRK